MTEILISTLDMEGVPTKAGAAGVLIPNTIAKVNPAGVLLTNRAIVPVLGHVLVVGHFGGSLPIISGWCILFRISLFYI